MRVAASESIAGDGTQTYEMARLTSGVPFESISGALKRERERKKEIRIGRASEMKLSARVDCDAPRSRKLISGLISPLGPFKTFHIPRYLPVVVRVEQAADCQSWLAGWLGRRQS